MANLCDTDRDARRGEGARNEGRGPGSGRSRDRGSAIRDRVRGELGDDRFGRYFGQGGRIDVHEGGIDLVASSPFMAQVLDRRVTPVVRRAMSAEGVAPLPVRVRVDRQAPRPEPERTPAPEPVQRARPARPQFSLRYSLETFLVGDSNRLAHSAGLRIADGIDDSAFSPLFIHGPSGVGKTHLLQGIARRAMRRMPAARVRYVTAESFTNEFIGALQSRAMDRFRRAWRGVKLLCLDDVHFLRGKEGTQHELLHTLDAIGLQDARIVLASDEHPRRIAALNEQLLSRFMGGAVVRIEEPDEALCRRLTSALAERLGLCLTPDGLDAMLSCALEQQRRSVREIEGLLTQVAAVRRLLPGEHEGGSVIDGPAVRRALRAGDGGASSRPQRRGPVRLETIVREVCEQMRVSREDLFGSGRHRRVVLARGLIVRLARELTTMSYPEIARGLHRPNHSTVITAFNRTGRQIEAGEPAACGPDLAGLTVGDLLDRLRAALAAAPRP